MNRGLSLELLFQHRHGPGDRTLSSVEIQPGKMTLTIPAMESADEVPSPALFRFPGAPQPLRALFFCEALQEELGEGRQFSSWDT